MTTALSTDIGPGTKVPEADPNCLRYMGDGWFYTYQHPKHTMRDILRPNYFDPICRKNPNSYLGAQLLVTVTNGVACTPGAWSTLLLRICQVRGALGVEAEQPTLVEIVHNFGKGTPAAHAGEPDAGSRKAA